MRAPGTYPTPRYTDPLDRRLVKIIQASEKSRPNAVNILGIPFDGAVLGRRGAKDGPAAIRQAMSGFSDYNVELRVGLEEARIFDLGDLAVDADDVIKAHREIESEVFRDLGQSSLLVLLGGDNSISLPALTAFERKFGEIGLVVIDSHFDLRGMIGGRPTSGSSYGLAMQSLPGLKPRRVAEIGIHGFLNSGNYARKAKELGIRVFTADRVGRTGADSVCADALAVASKGATSVYVSVDLDAVDLGWVSGVSAPSVGGIVPDELFGLVYALAKNPSVRCIDIVELAPNLDPTGRSQVVAATALTYAAAGFVSRKPR